MRSWRAMVLKVSLFFRQLKNQLFLDYEEKQIYLSTDSIYAPIVRLGMKVTDICRDKGITTATFYGWESKYGGMDTQQLKKLKSLQEENRRLKQMYPDLSLDHCILKDNV